MTRRATLLATLGLCIAGLSGCAEPVPVTLWVEKAGIAAFSAGLWREPQVTLLVEDEGGAPQRIEVYVPSSEEWLLVDTPLLLPCDEDLRCELKLRAAPKVLRFALSLSAEDHCGARAPIATFGPAERELTRGGSIPLDFRVPNTEFDDDGDGVINLYELETCGRLNAADAAALPLGCADQSDPCCENTGDEAAVSDGDMVVFDGGEHRLAGEGGVIIVEPFALDATELTWRQLYRCVAGGQCLWDDLPDAVWDGLVDDELRQMPVVGLTPRQADEVCRFFGKRLPLDVEHDFAAAADGAGGRYRYPWGDEETLRCREEPQAVAANFSELGRACENATVAVGRFPSSHAHRSGGALADLAGNVPEWTLLAGTPPLGLSVDVVPEGVGGVALRGGGFRSPATMLENDFVVAMPMTGDDVDAWARRVEELASGAGFRCAASVESATTAADARRCGDASDEGTP